MVTYRDRAATPLIAYKISVFVPGLGTDVPLTLKHDRKLTFRNVELGRWILRQIQRQSGSIIANLVRLERRTRDHS
jgi:hypothetical protein